MSGVAAPAPVNGSPLTQTANPASQAKFHRAAQQFEAMFLGEMLRMAHPASNATGIFATGVGEKSWQGFMDQALGQALAAGGHTGLTSVIEKALATAQEKGTPK